MKAFFWGLLFTVTAVVVAGVVLLNLNLMRVEFGEEKKTPQLHLGGKVVELPMLTAEKDIGETAQALGYEKVWAFKAQHGVLDGFVEFDGGDKKPLSQSADFAKGYLANNRDGATSFSAVVIVTLSDPTNPKDRKIEGKRVFDCQLVQRIEARTTRSEKKDGADAKTSHSEAFDNVIKGKLTVEVVAGTPTWQISTSDTAVSISKSVGEKKKAHWLEFKVVEAPKVEAPK